MNEKRVLFLMHEGIESTIFQSQVAVHALEMKRFGYNIEIWTFETTLRSLGRSRRNLELASQLCNCRVRLLRGVYVFLPLSDLLNALILLFHIKRSGLHLDLVHARTDYSAAVYSWIRNLVGAPMIWDCRGDSYREVEYSLSKRKRVPGFVKAGILAAAKRDEAKAGSCCVAANFVSSGLLARKARSLHGQPAFTIPCPVSGVYFHFDEGLRKDYRTRLGYRRDDLVLIYSGGISTYQGFDAYVDLVARISKAGGSNVRLLVVTPDVRQAQTYISGQLPDHVYKLCSATYAEMNGYLNAADYGALLRARNEINDVASPTKFGEYCLAGLPVVLDGNVQQALEVSKAIGNYTSYTRLMDGERLVPWDAKKRADISLLARRFFAREVLNEEYDRMYKTAMGLAS